MPTKVEAFKCDYCGRLLKFPRTAAVHEASCKNNPSTRHCITCIHGISASYATVPSWADPYGPGTEISGPYCGYFDKPIADKPYFIECETSGGIDTGFGWITEEPVPFTCLWYKSKGKAEWTPVEQYERSDE